MEFHAQCAAALKEFLRKGAVDDNGVRLAHIACTKRTSLENVDAVRVEHVDTDMKRHLAWGIGLVTTSVLLLSAAGIYALMSFTVVQRTREIGVRTALGARPHQLLLSIFGRVTRQLVLGLLAGSLLSGTIFVVTEIPLGRAVSLLLSIAAIMLVVGLLAALGPARRGLRIRVSEALRSEG